MKIGFIGLGIMGKPIVSNILKKGYCVLCYDINPKPVEELAGLGAQAAQSIKEIGQTVDTVFTMLPASAHVEEVVLGKGGLLENIKKDAVIFDLSSIDPDTAKKIGQICKSKNVHFFDSPVSGGEPKAIDGALALMTGGNKKILETIYPILKTFAEKITWVGENGAGSTVKLANQIIVNLNIAAVSEAFCLAASCSIDPKIVYEAIRGGLAGSAVLEAKAEKMFTRNFKAGGRIDINQKDIGNVLKTSHKSGAVLPLTAQLYEMMIALSAAGLQKEDHSAILKYYEKLSCVEVKTEKQ